MAINKTPIASPKWKGTVPQSFVPRTKGAPEIFTSILDNTLYISHDLGVTWFKAESVHDPDTCCVDLFTRYIGVQNKAHDTLYISVDDGITFNRFPLPKDILKTGHIPCSVSFSHPKSLIIKGTFPALKRDLICYTKDSGKTWNFSTSWNECRFVEGDQFVDNLVHCGVVKKIADKIPFYSLEMYYTTELFSGGPIKPIDFDPHDGQTLRDDECWAFENVLFQHKRHTDELLVCFDGINVETFKIPPNLWPRGVEYTITNCKTGYFESKGKILFHLKPESPRNATFHPIPDSKLVVLDRNSNQLKLLLDNTPCGFKCIDSNNGTFVANIVPNIEMTKYLQAEKSPNKYKPKDYENIKCRTVISHDGGEHWSPLIGPNGAELNLAPTKVYEDEHYGMVTIPTYGTYIAYGNEGAPLKIANFRTLLTSKDEKLKTYITRDSGYTWSELSAKPMLYVIGNRGKIIFEEPHYDTEVDALVYSVDSGVTWHRYELGFWALAFIANGYTYTSNNFQIGIRKGNESYSFTLSFVDDS